MKITSEEIQNYSGEPWYQAYQDFMAVLSELDNEKAPEIGATYDLGSPHSMVESGILFFNL